MKKMIAYELKHLWTLLTAVAVISLVILSTVLTFINVLGSEKAVTENGDIIEGISSYRAVKNESDVIKGVLDQEYFDRLIKEYNQSVEKDQLGDRIGHYLTKYTFSNYLINYGKYGKDFNTSKMDLDETIDEAEFYQQYKKSMSEVIENSNKFNWFAYTEDHMKKINDKISELETPFRVDYFSGLNLLSWQFGRQFWFVLLVLAATLCPLFSKDTKNGISELTLSSKLGRRKNMTARVIAGNILAIGVYILFVLIMLIEIGIVASFEGYDQSIQNLWYTCIYNMSMGDGIIIMLLSGLLTVLIFANLIMLISMTIKYVKLSSLLSILMIFFLNSLNNVTLMGQLNPISRSIRLSSGLPNPFNIFFFIGDVVVPYTIFFVILGAVYLAIIRLITIKRYKKYRLN